MWILFQTWYCDKLIEDSRFYLAGFDDEQQAARCLTRAGTCVGGMGKWLVTFIMMLCYLFKSDTDLWTRCNSIVSCLMMSTFSDCHELKCAFKGAM